MKSAITLADAASIDVKDVFDLSGAYNEALSTKKRDDRQGYFHPSAVGRCGRANVYEYIRAPRIDTLEPESTEIFDLGHAIHALVGTKLNDVSRILKPKNIGFSLQQEVPYDPATDRLFVDFGLGGTTDGLLEIWADSWRQRAVLETKSINKAGFEGLRGHAKFDHVMQAHIYAFRFDCPIIYIWYYCKDNSQREVIPVVFQTDILMAALTRFQVLLQHADAGTLPNREEDFFACPRCEYREVCDPTIIHQIRSKTRSKADGKKIDELRKRKF